MGEKHKPFKGGKGKKRQKGKENVKSTLGKKTHKIVRKSDRKNTARLIQKNKRQAVIEQQRRTSHMTRNVLVIQLCSGATAFDAASSLVSAMSLMPANQEYSTNLFTSKSYENSIRFVPLTKSLSHVLEANLVADFVVFALSGTHGVDEWGEQVQSALRAQGVPAVFPYLISGSSDIKDEWNDYFYKNYSKEIKVYTPETAEELRRKLFTSVPKDIVWKSVHPSMVVDRVGSVFNGNVCLSGYLRGPLFQNKVFIPLLGKEFSIVSINGSVITAADEDNLYANRGLIGHFEIDESDAETVTDHSMLDSDDSMSIDENINESEFETDVYDDLQEPLKVKQVRFDSEESEYEEENGDEIAHSRDVCLSELLRDYRGLKSFRHGQWDPFEALPEEYKHISAFQNTKASSNRALAASKSTLLPGDHVEIVVRGLMPEDQSKLAKNTSMIIVIGLLPYEDQTSVIHFSVNQYPLYTARISSHNTCTLYYGYRKMTVSPIFSENSTGNLHTFIRNIKVDDSVLASVYGPPIWGNPPTLLVMNTTASQKLGHQDIIDQEEDVRMESKNHFFSTGICAVYRDDVIDENALSLMTTGSLIEINPNRIILKRKTLCGDPFKVHKNTAVVRNMFFNPDDVKYFQPVPLITKSGKFGHIKESLGTHGYMKVVFEKPIHQHDTVSLHLYKRIFPNMSS